jgi:glycerol-3-phosphate dehydrogenase
MRDLKSLADRRFDVVVVGGGICGAAIAWDASRRGLSVALLERDDFCARTSAYSLKFVHGGIRYLQHLDFKRVRESCRERSALLRVAPHLVHPIPVVVPTFGHALQGGEALAAAFALLSFVTADRNDGISDPERRIPPGTLVSKRQLLEWFPVLEAARPNGAGVFSDGQIYNPPRLVWEFVRSAAAAGAVCANWCDVTGLLKEGDRACGVRVEDRVGGARFEVRADTVVNAAGPFAEQILVKDGVRRERTIPFSRDMALIFARKPDGPRALAVQTKYADPDAVLSRGHRHLFFVPWRDRLMIGVNSKVYPDEPYGLRVPEAEVMGFIQEIQEAAPWLGAGPGDVAMVYAGLLPFGQNDAGAVDLSFGKRSHVIDHLAKDGVDGLVSAISVRLTTARGVAEEVVDLVFTKRGNRPPTCDTQTARLAGASFLRFADLVAEIAGKPEVRGDARVAESLAHNHGSRYDDVLRLAREKPELSVPIGESTTLAAEVVHAVRSEMACTLEDVVLRRTDLATTGDPGDAALARCAALAGAELGWTDARRREEIDGLKRHFPNRSGLAFGS